MCNGLLTAQQTNVFILPFPQQYQALDAIIDSLAAHCDPKAASIRLKKLELQARETNKELSLLNYKRSEIRYRYIRTINNEKPPVLDQLIIDTEQLITKVNEQKYPVIAALLHFQIGNSLDYQKYNYKEQFKHYLMAYEIFKKIPLAQFPYRYYSQYAIALAYYQFEEYDKAIALSNEVEALFPKKDFNSIITTNLIGLSYSALKKYNQSIAAFEWILKNNKYALSPKAWKGIALCNLGDVYNQKGKWTAAASYLEQGIPILKQEAVYGNMASAAVILASIYVAQNNLVDAKRNLDIAIEGNTKVSKIANSYSIYKVMSDYFKVKGDHKLALQYLQLTNIYKDSIDSRTNISKKFKAEINFEKERNLLVQNQIKTKIRNQRKFIFILVVLTILVLITIYFYFDRGRLKLKIEQQELIDKNTKISTELELANFRLEEYTQSRLVKDIEHPINSENQENIVSKLVNEISLYTDDDWSEFRNLFEKAHPGYFQKVKGKLPKISAAELRFIAVHKLNLSTNEMAMILNISADAVRKIKKRLSLKIAENLNHSFDEFIYSLQY